MSRLDEIKARRETYETCESDDYECDGDSCCGNDNSQEDWCEGRKKNDPFWDNLEDDEAWLIEEVERLQAFHDKVFEVFELYPDDPQPSDDEVIAWIEEARRDQRDYNELKTEEWLKEKGLEGE